MFTQTQVVGALRRLPNKSDFCKRHDIAERTIFNLLSEGHNATKTTLKVVGAALVADKLLKEPVVRKRGKA